MNVLVVNSPNSPFSSRGILIEPIDALVLASFVQSLGHAVELLDMDVMQMSLAQFESRAAQSNWDVVAIVFDYHIPLHADGALGMALKIAAIAKEAGAKVAVAGKAATYTPGELLSVEGPVDVLIRHEAEPALEHLLNLERWDDGSLGRVAGVSYMSAGEIVQTPRPPKAFNLDRLPIPDRNLADLDSYIDVRTILTSRGCHMKCDFCHVPGFWGGWRGRAAQSVADEIEILEKEHGAQKILFLDDNAPVGKRRMAELCEELIRRKTTSSLGCLASLDCFDPKLMDSMLAAGFRWLHYGVESGDDRLLKSISKRADANAIRRVVAESKAMGFRVRTSWILDLPTTSAEELGRTEDMILETRSHEVRLHHLALRLGSRFGETHSSTPSTQYIHQGAQNQNLCADDVGPEAVAAVAERVASELGGSGYAVVRHPDEFLDVEALGKRCDGMKVVSLCPLRYGLAWRR